MSNIDTIMRTLSSSDLTTSNVIAYYPLTSVKISGEYSVGKCVIPQHPVTLIPVGPGLKARAHTH